MNRTCIRHAIAAAVLTLAPAALASPATDSFEKLKALAGTWTVTDPSGAATTASYEVVSDGSAVVERFGDMMTMFTVDGDSILATHYCSAHNQPRMRAIPTDGATELTFNFVDASGDMSNGSIHDLHIAFVDANSFSEDWTYMGTDSSTSVSHFDIVRQ